MIKFHGARAPGRLAGGGPVKLNQNSFCGFLSLAEYQESMAHEQLEHDHHKHADEHAERPHSRATATAQEEVKVVRLRLRSLARPLPLSPDTLVDVACCVCIVGTA